MQEYLERCPRIQTTSTMCLSPWYPARNFFRGMAQSNWLGNDRYFACVKLEPGVKPETLAPAVRAMQVKYQDIEKLEKEQGGTVLNYTFKPIRKIHTDNVKDMIIILSTIAISVLFVSLMNYILLTLSALVNRAKSSAIHKTCGAQARNLQQLIFYRNFFAVFYFDYWSSPHYFDHKTLGRIATATHFIFGVKSICYLAHIGNYCAIGGCNELFARGVFFRAFQWQLLFGITNRKKTTGSWHCFLAQFIGASFILTMMVIVTMQYSNMKKCRPRIPDKASLLWIDHRNGWQ